MIRRVLVRKLAWSDDQTVDFRPCGSDKLLLIPTESKQRPVKPTFVAFAATVVRVLTENPLGLTWSRIRELGELEQTTPNPIWVYRMEKEHGLRRIRDGKTLQTMWRLDNEANGGEDS